jgi:glycerol-3-phosphate dehydrogenase
MLPTPLSPERRTAAWDRLTSEEVDVLVVGGGIVGAGSALDAVSRGFNVAIVEAQDWAAGTSSRSSKLIHGGLRYLQMMDFVLVHQALRERAILLHQVAPHLVHQLPFLYPLRHRLWERVYVGAGIALYDILGWSTGTSRGVPRHRHLSQRQALAMAPGLRKESMIGAIEYYDAQVDDARLVLEVVRTATSLGATPISRAQAVGFLRDGDRTIGARVRDLETGIEHDVYARVTIVATGAWTEETEALAGHGRPVQVRPSKGIHLVVPRDRISSASAIVVRTEKSVLFILPWGQHWIIGTTDTDWVHDKARPEATAADVDYLLDHVNSVLASPLHRDDITAVFAGLRPLIAGAGVVRGPGEAGAHRLRLGTQAGQEQTTTLSREHSVGRPSPGLVVVSGGKYTTYRIIARDAVDAAIDQGQLDRVTSATERLPLLGVDGYAVRWHQRARLAATHGLSDAQLAHLLHRYGGMVDELLVLVNGDPTLGAPLGGAEDYLRAEVAYAVTHEDARHLEDVLLRRTRIGIETVDRGLSSVDEVAALMAPLLGWDDAQRDAEIEDYRLQSALEASAADAPDDDAASRLVAATPTLLPIP